LGSGWAKFVSMQDMYNLVYREEKKEMYPMLLDQDIACTPFSSLAYGVFAKRPEHKCTDGVAKLQNDYVLFADAEIIRRVGARRAPWRLYQRHRAGMEPDMSNASDPKR
jgi:aryl-alcohol dehydrogenase-like predicted oxidoreductase